jgi:hypothetical protein
MASVPGVFWGQFTITDGRHILESAKGFQAWAYGMGDYNSYAFPLGYGTSTITTGIGTNTPDIMPSATIMAPSGTLIDRQRAGLAMNEPLVIMDATGRVVTTEPPGSTLALPHAPGSYFISLASGSAIVTRLMVY